MKKLDGTPLNKYFANPTGIMLKVNGKIYGGISEKYFFFTNYRNQFDTFGYMPTPFPKSEYCSFGVIPLKRAYEIILIETKISQLDFVNEFEFNRSTGLVYHRSFFPVEILIKLYKNYIKNGKFFTARYQF